MNQNNTEDKGKTVVAVDLGASSGRVICATYNEEKLYLNEIHRFANEGIYVGERFYTDILYLYHEIITGLRKAWQKNKDILSVGIDCWGVDIVILDKAGEMISNPYHYRDIQSAGMIDLAEKIFGKQELFRQTGIQDMWYNTVYQLMGIAKRKPDLIEKMSKFVMLPDALGYFLTEKINVEYTTVSTTQMYSMSERRWADSVIYELGLRKDQMPEIVMTGTEKGYFTDRVKQWIGIPENRHPILIATAEHDSAAAAFAVPAEKDSYIFINSGTWSIIGMVRDQPVITEAVYEKEYSNEGAAFGRIKLVNTIMGMWLIQELRKVWEKNGKRTDYGFLINEAMKTEPFKAFIDVDDELFIAPDDMEKAIDRFCIRTGQTPVREPSEYYRTVMESLAFKYKEAVSGVEELTGETTDTVYLLGGAVQDHMFCQFIANATGKRVSAGPVEATAIGNALVQMKSLGILKNEKECTKLVKKSFDVCYYEPEDVDQWNQMYEKYKRITGTEK